MPPTAASTWAAKPPTRPSGVRPIPAQIPAAPTAAPNSPRPSLIPGARPSTSMPVVPSGSTPQPSTSAPAPAAARPPLNRTMMGFPSVKPPVAAKPAVPSPPAPPRLTPAAPMAVVPSHPVAATISPPLDGPVTVKAPTPLPPTATPAAPAAIARPVVPRFAPPPPPAPPVLAPTPSAAARPVVSPVPPPTTPAKALDIAAPPLEAAVSSAVDRKVAAMAARGPEYEAIAKLSRRNHRAGRVGSRPRACRGDHPAGSRSSGELQSSLRSASSDLFLDWFRHDRRFRQEFRSHCH